MHFIFSGFTEKLCMLWDGCYVSVRVRHVHWKGKDERGRKGEGKKGASTLFFSLAIALLCMQTPIPMMTRKKGEARKWLYLPQWKKRSLLRTFFLEMVANNRYAFKIHKYIYIVADTKKRRVGEWKKVFFFDPKKNSASLLLNFNLFLHVYIFLFIGCIAPNPVP